MICFGARMPNSHLHHHHPSRDFLLSCCRLIPLADWDDDCRVVLVHCNLCHKLRCLKIGHNRYSCIRHATPTASYLQQKNIRLGNKYFVKVQVPVPKMYLSTAQVPVPVPSTTRLGQTDRRTPADSYYRAYTHGQRPQGRIIKRPIRIALRSKNLWCRVCSEGKPAAVYYIGYIISLHTEPSSVARFIR